MLRIVIFVCVVVCGAVIEAKPDFPPYIKLCSRKNLKPCILENMEKIRPHMKKGIPKLGLPSSNPFTIPQVVMKNNNLNVVCDNLNIYHMEDYQLKNIDMDLDANKLSVDMNFPFLEIDSQYTMDGKILILELNGKGKVISNFTNLFVSVNILGQRVTKDGKEHIGFKEGEFKLSYDGPIYMYFTDLFPGREDLTKNTNAVINESTKEFIKEIEPVIKSSIRAVIETVVKYIFDKYSVDELFTNE